MSLTLRSKIFLDPDGWSFKNFCYSFIEMILEKKMNNKNFPIFFSFVDFRKIGLLAKTTHTVRLHTKAAITNITLRIPRNC